MQNSANTKPLQQNPSYYRKEPLVVTEKMRRQIQGAFAEIDLEQIKVLKKLTPAERFRQACAMVTSVNRAAAFQLVQKDPTLSEHEALKIVRSGRFIQHARQLR